MNSFLRWAGSKRKLLPELVGYWNESFKRYVEPFMGSACLFFALEPKKALLGDLNEDLILTYTEVRDNYPSVAAELRDIPRTEKTYYSVRSQEVRSLTPAQRAARFIYLNRFCFNGLYRTNLRGIFNVPYGGKDSGNLPDEETLQRASVLLRQAKLKCCSFEKLIAQTRRGDIVYLDPPYSVRKRRVFREYGDTSFSDRHLPVLKRSMQSLSARGIPFILSYASSREGHELAEGYTCRKIMTRRHIAGFANFRRNACELIVTNANKL